LRKKNSPFDEIFHENKWGQCDSLNLTSHFGQILYPFRLPGEEKKVQLCFHISLSQNAYPDSVVPLHLDIICRWVVGVMKVVVGSSCPTMF